MSSGLARWIDRRTGPVRCEDISDDTPQMLQDRPGPLTHGEVIFATVQDEPEGAVALDCMLGPPETSTGAFTAGVPTTLSVVIGSPRFRGRLAQLLHEWAASREAVQIELRSPGRAWILYDDYLMIVAVRQAS